MATSRIFSVGYSFPGGEVEQISFESDQSLLDADIIIYEPSLGDHYSSQAYQGKPRLSEDSSFRVKEQLSHWWSELKGAFDAGKLVVVFLAKPEDVFVATGEKKFSGTGRSQRVTQMVEPASSYEAIPLALEPNRRSGREIAPEGDLGFLAPYWNEFGDQSPYEATVSGKFGRILLRTKSGNAIVGASVLGARGALLLLPPLRYDEEAFTSYDEDGDEVWNEDARAFGRRLASTLAALAKEVRERTEQTPSPGWSQNSGFRLPREEEFQAAIRQCTTDIEAIQQRRSELEGQLREAGQLRALLYGKGRELEAAVIKALVLLEFEAESYVDDESEFDIVFSAGEGRFLDEVEGKDKRAINMDKLSQLERNIQEDFARDEVGSYANGVLFGNAHRLVEATDRGRSFTEKCVSGARRSGIALVRTSDLFEPARYLAANEDAAYAEACRRAIADASGEVVDFPKPPQEEEATGEAELARSE